MGRRPGEHHPKAGKFQHNPEREFDPPPPPLVRAERVELAVGDDEPVYYWSTSGDLYTDAALTEPVGLAILRPLRQWDAHEGIPTNVTGTHFQRVATERGRRVVFQDEGGNLYADERLTDPLGLTIVRLVSRAPATSPRPARRVPAGPLARSQEQFRTIEDDEDDLDH